jgi:hypothetical protein
MESSRFDPFLLFLRSSVAAVLALATLAGPLSGAVVVIGQNVGDSVDTVLREDQVGDNFGGFNRLWVGTNGKSTPRDMRSLLEFDLSSVPAGAVINSVTLTMRVTDSHSVTSTFGLYRALADWGEGTKTGKGGATATSGEASWNNRLTGSAAWAAPGGQAGVDYNATASASRSISGTGSVTWSSTSALVSDVQHWLTNPNQNYGWFIISGGEGVKQSVKRFASSEDTTVSYRPTLTIDYTLAEAIFSLLSGPAPSPLRVMRNGTDASALLVKNTGTGSGSFAITEANNMTVIPSSQSNVAAESTVALAARWSDVSTTGARVGSFKIHNANGGSDGDDLVAVTGAVVDNRAIASSPVDFGRYALGALATKSVAATLTTTGGSDQFTNVLVKAAAVEANGDGVAAGPAAADVLFNDAGDNMARTVSLNKITTTAGLVSGSLAMTVQGEGLSGEIASARIPYSYRVVTNRVVTGPSTTVDFGHLLLGASASASITLSSSIGDDALYTRVSVANQSSGGLSLDGLPLVFDGSVAANTRTTTFVAEAAGVVNTTAQFAVTPEGIGDSGYAPVAVNYKANVGNASAKATPAGVGGLAATFDPASKLVAQVSSSYAGLSSTVVESEDAVGTAAMLLAGAAQPGQVSMNWRTRADDEKHPGLLFPEGSAGGISDVLELLGTEDSTFVLQMTYDPNLLPGGAASEIGEAAGNMLHIAWLDTNGWVNAGNGTNNGAWTDYAIARGITNPDAPIAPGLVGDWGVDTVSHSAWVIVDHNSQFMVVPEPSSLLLLVVSVAAATIAVRRRRVKAVHDVDSSL